MEDDKEGVAAVDIVRAMIKTAHMPKIQTTDCTLYSVQIMPTMQPKAAANTVRKMRFTGNLMCLPVFASFSDFCVFGHTFCFIQSCLSSSLLRTLYFSRTPTLN